MLINNFSNFFFIDWIIIIILILITSQKYINYCKNKNFLIDKNNLEYGYKPTPTGFGIFFLIIFLLYFTFLITFENKDILLNTLNRWYVFIFGAVVLCIISYLDDIKSIDPKLRLLVQLITIYFSITNLDSSSIDLPIKIKFFILIFVWIYILNITNFIDGSDGFLASQSIYFFTSVCALTYLTNVSIYSAYIALMILPILVGFIIVNAPFAKIYMGDAGSIFLGFLIGFSFLEICLEGYYFYAFAIYAYPLTDCSIMLTKKFVNGKMPWVRLSDYFFLKPIIKNKNNQKFVFYSFNFFLFINFIITTTSLIYKNEYILIFSYIFSLTLCFAFWKKHLGFKTKILNFISKKIKNKNKFF